MIRKNVDGLSEYLESRLVKTNQTKNIKLGGLSEEFKATTIATIRMDIDKTSTKLFDNEQALQEVDVKMLDVPYVIDYDSQVCENFFTSLGDVDNFAIFGVVPLQKLIDFMYPLVWRATIMKLFIPFLFFHLSFVIYMNVIAPEVDANPNN